jgi:hypothetical protein
MALHSEKTVQSLINTDEHGFAIGNRPHSKRHPGDEGYISAHCFIGECPYSGL